MPSHGSGCGIKSAVHLLARRTMSLPYQGVAGVDLREADDSQTEMTAEHASQVAMTVMRLFRSLERVEGGLTPQQYRILKLAGAGGVIRTEAEVNCSASCENQSARERRLCHLHGCNGPELSLRTGSRRDNKR